MKVTSMHFCRELYAVVAIALALIKGASVSKAEHTVGSDAFSVGSSSIIDKYCSTYLYMNDFYDRMNATMIGEDMLSCNLSKQCLTGDKLIYMNMNNPFPPNGYDSMWNSYLREDLHEWK